MNSQPFVDANIFLRFLTKDDVKKAEKCFQLFQKAERKEISLTTSEAVLSEVVYILSSKRLYQLKTSEIKERLWPLISISGLKLPSKKRFLLALDIYAKNNIDFADALTVAHLYQSKTKKVYSYDRDFDRFPKIQRLEP